MPLRRPFGLTPFWFLNDRLDRAESLRQLAAMDEAGVGGVVLHPRVGLPREQGWMSPALLDICHAICREAARRGLRVILYDEGMYPSGSASGGVVASNPAFQCRGWICRDHDWLSARETLVGSYTTAGGRPRFVIDTPVPSVIRGLHYLGPDDGGAHSPESDAEDTPPAADLLNPEAMACFLRLTHDVYQAHLGEFFGDPITGIFTDEPSLLGRLTGDARALGRIIPGTTGLLDHARRLTGIDFAPKLAALFEDDLPDGPAVRRAWAMACRLRLEETYYRPMSEWCQRHGLELMGHPEGPDDFAVQRYFHVPGQDLVWRWVLPGPTATRGRQSTQCKSAASAAARFGRARCSNEFAGAYGHELTFHEFLWLTHHCLVRGINWLIPHAYYYSLRGPRRDERPPDVGLWSRWADQLGRYNAYAERLCRLVATCPPVIHVGLIAGGDEAPDAAAEWLFRHQYDFEYILDTDLGTPWADGYRVLVHDGIGDLPRDFEGVVRTDVPGWEAALQSRISPTLVLRTPAPGLRVRRITDAPSLNEAVLVFNEEEQAARLEPAEFRTWIDPWQGTAGPLESGIVVPPGELRILCNTESDRATAAWGLT